MREPLKIQVRHILVPYEHEINDIRRKLNQGEEFEELARKFSQCPSYAHGGDLGAITPGRTVQEFEDAAMRLEIGETSGPVRTKFGWHLIHRYG